MLAWYEDKVEIAVEVHAAKGTHRQSCDTLSPETLSGCNTDNNQKWPHLISEVKANLSVGNNDMAVTYGMYEPSSQAN